MSRVWESVVVIVRVLCVGDAVVVVVDIVVLRVQKSLPQNSLVPDRLEPAVVVGISVGAVIVVVFAVGADEERALRFCVCVIVPVVVGIDLEVVPNAIVVVVDVPMVVDAIEVVIEVGGVIEHTLRIHIASDRCPAVIVGVDIVVQQIGYLVWEHVAIAVRVPLKQAVVHADVSHPQIAVVLDLIVSYSCARTDVLIAEEVEPEAVLVAGPLALRVAAVIRALVKLGIWSGAVWRGVNDLLLPGSALQRVPIQPGVSQTAGMLGHSILYNCPNQTRSASPIVEGPAHLQVINIEDAVVALVLVPPVWQSISVLIGVNAVHKGISVKIDVEVVATVVRTPLHENIPVHLGNFAVGYGPVVVVVAVVVEDEIVS